MPRRIIPLLPESCYHIYNRGHNYPDIFLEEENYAFFLHRLRQYVAGRHATVVAYALMPNHYHLLIQVLSEGFSHAIA